MKTDRLSWLVGLLVFVFAGWWIVANTEWVESKRYTGLQGEAAHNPVYALERFLTRLGMRVEHRASFDPLPPAGERLLLLSNDWELIPGRGEALHQWVLRGGHLVLPTDVDARALSAWLPVSTVTVKKYRPAAAASAASAVSEKQEDDDDDDEDDGIRMTSTPPLWGDVSQLSACLLSDSDQRLRAQAGLKPAWTLARELGAEALRVPLGKGSVTVLNAHRRAFFNSSVLECENSLLVAAAVQAKPGAFMLIYLNEKREALLPWLWREGWIVIVTGLLALAAAVRRASVRFGPRLASQPRLRRSIAEQVRGLGHYLQREGPDALLIAQQRALAEVAVRHLPDYQKLAPNQRAAAIAKATGIDGDALATALIARTCKRAELAGRLQVLESARRRLNRIPDECKRPP